MPHGAGDQECTLAVIQVLVRSRKGGKAVQTYAFWDTCSSISFMSERLMERLGVNGKQARIKLDTMGATHTPSTSIIKDLEICDLEGKNAVHVPQFQTPHPDSRGHNKMAPPAPC
jgi:hypothetical protein